MPSTRAGRVASATARAVAEIAVSAGLALLLFAAYWEWGTASVTVHAQERLMRQLHQADVRPHAHAAVASRSPADAAPANGRPLAEIRIPRLGADYRYVVVEGTTPADLRTGPGHYAGSALPGKVGNFVVSGHRTTYAAPFNRIDELRPGDRILVSAGGVVYVYRVTGTHVVLPTDLAVTAPVPGHPGATPHLARITLTTCHPKYSAARRLVVVGRLAGTRRAGGTTGSS
ncbi:MAG TPA: class E sortase [Streptosporangiales bacterium]